MTEQNLNSNITHVSSEDTTVTNPIIHNQNMISDEPKVINHSPKAYATLSWVLQIIFGFWAPLIFSIINEEQSDFLELHTKAGLNFAISLMLYYIIASILTIIFIGYILFVVLVPFSIVIPILAALKAK